MQAKTDPFSEEHVSLAAFAAALSHPARIAIITLLQKRPRASCGEIVDALPLAQATVSQHLKTLVDNGMLLQEREGHKIMYSINCDRVRAFCHMFQCCLGTQPPQPNTP